MDKAKMKEKQKQAQEFRKSEDVVAVVAEFQPRFSQIAANVQAAWREIGALTAELIEACNLTHDADGRKQFNSLLRLLTLEPYVAQVAGQFASVYMADINFNVLITDDKGKESRKYQDDARGLKQAAKDANEALGISRKREKSGKRDATPSAEKLGEDVWGALETIPHGEAFWHKFRAFANKHGYEVSPLMGKAEIPAAAVEQRKLRKAA